MTYCSTCGEYRFSERHACKPVYQVRYVWKEGEFDDWKDFRAIDGDEAAEKWAEWYDPEGDYSIVRGSPATVEVKSPDGEIKRYTVEGETVAQYTAREAKPPAVGPTGTLIHEA